MKKGKSSQGWRMMKMSKGKRGEEDDEKLDSSLGLVITPMGLYHRRLFIFSKELLTLGDLKLLDKFPYEWSQVIHHGR